MDGSTREEIGGNRREVEEETFGPPKDTLEVLKNKEGFLRYKNLSSSIKK